MYCTKCKQDKDVSHFRVRTSLKRGYQSWCKECEGDANKQRYKPKKDKQSKQYDPMAALKRMLKHRYNMTYDEYLDLYNKQEGKCAICKEEKILGTKSGLLVDHNHTTNIVRGLLCNNCNTALGKFKDNMEILTNAISYISINK